MTMTRSWKAIKNNGSYQTRSSQQKRSKPFPMKAKRQMPSAKQNRAKPTCTVYGLHDGDGHIRYVGQTRQSLEARLAWHKLQSVLGDTDVNVWVGWAIHQAREVHIISLEEVATWNSAERRWINQLSGNGLVNRTRGGNHAAPMTGPTLRMAGVR